MGAANMNLGSLFSRYLLGCCLAYGTCAQGDEAAALYTRLCAGCHAQGSTALADSPYPPLFGNPNIAAGGPAFVAFKALQGAGNMFPFCSLATDAEVVAVANYLAAANGNHDQPLDSPGAATLRPTSGDCAASDD